MSEPETSLAAPQVISATRARGALGPDSGSVGDTLMPMLISALLLTIIGVSFAAMFAFL